MQAGSSWCTTSLLQPPAGRTCSAVPLLTACMWPCVSPWCRLDKWDASQRTMPLVEAGGVGTSAGKVEVEK